MGNNNFQLYRQKAKLAVDRYYRVRKDMKVSFNEGRLEEIETLASPFLKGCFTLAVIGKMSSGKSTFINAFLKNGKLLPTGYFQTTCAITEIIPSSEKKLEITYHNNKTPQSFHGEEIFEILNKTVKIPDEFNQLPINKINSMLCEGYDIATILQEKENIEKETDLIIDQELLIKYISSTATNNIPSKIVIYHPLDEVFNGWKIVDTPGINADGGIEDTTWNLLEGNNDIEGNNVDAIIFVHKGEDSPQDKTIRESIKSIFEKLTSEAKKRIFFVITHASERNFINNKETVIEYCKNQFKQYGIDANKIISVDSLLELLENWRHENNIDPQSLSDCYDELTKEFKEDDCDTMIGIVDLIERLLKKEHKETNAENILNKINEIVGFPILREQLNLFVKETKENTYKELIKTIEGDLKYLKTKKNEEREILTNRCIMSPKDYETDIENRKTDLKRLKNDVLRDLNTIFDDYSLSYINNIFLPIKNDFDDTLRNLFTEDSIKKLPSHYYKQIENEQNKIISKISSKFKAEFERKIENKPFPSIDTLKCLKNATKKITEDKYENDDNTFLGKIKRFIPFIPKNLGRKLLMKKGEFYCDIKTLKKNIKTEFHKELNDYCSIINLQVINYLVILTSDITEKIEIKESELNDLLNLHKDSIKINKQIEHLNYEIEYLVKNIEDFKIESDI